MIRILHLSDLHLAEESGQHAFYIPRTGNAMERSVSRTLADAILRALEDSNFQADAIAVTGDLTWQAAPGEFDLALEQISIICQALKLDLAKHVLLIPGNHDADWKAKNEEKRFAEFRKCFRKFVGRDVGPELQQTLTIEKNSRKLHLLGVNSAAFESRRHAGIGLVGHKPLEEMISSLSRNEDDDIILCMHHHLLPVASMEWGYFGRRRTSVTLDARAVLSFCAKHQIGMVLHGHQHQPLLTRYSSLDPVSPNAAQSRPVWISGAGTCGASNQHTGDIARRHFQLLSFDASPGGSQCDIASFVTANEDPQGFTPCGPPVPVKLSPHSTHDRQSVCDAAASTSHRMTRLGSTPDHKTQSDLYIIFCKVRAGGDAYRFLIRHSKSCEGANWAEMVGLYPVFGSHDLVLKVRASSDKYVKRSLLEPLEKRYWAANNGSAWYTSLSIEHEQHARTGGPPIPTNKETRAIRAFVWIKRNIGLQSMQTLLRPRYKSASGALISSYVGSSGAVAEIVVPCGGFYQIEQMLKKQIAGADLDSDTRETFLALGTWPPEPQPENSTSAGTKLDDTLLLPVSLAREPQPDSAHQGSATSQQSGSSANSPSAS
jgi:3',5'-cyclic AMP phosphodiesterase CpdA